MHVIASRFQQFLFTKNSNRTYDVFVKCFLHCKKTNKKQKTKTNTYAKKNVAFLLHFICPITPIDFRNEFLTLRGLERHNSLRKKKQNCLYTPKYFSLWHLCVKDKWFLKIKLHTFFFLSFKTKTLFRLQNF